MSAMGGKRTLEAKADARPEPHHVQVKPLKRNQFDLGPTPWAFWLHLLRAPTLSVLRQASRALEQ